ncbi:MAG TPA: helix-turn-helix transcriptional regulator [Jiangellaceae bacterium]
MASDESRRVLARRLQQLREEQWDVHVTQRALAKALGVSEALISSWENQREPVTPPRRRLTEYATFFATRRSIEGRGSKLLPVGDLDRDERATRDELLKELTALREKAVRAEASPHRVSALGGSWHFADGGPVRIVCAELPKAQLNSEITPTHPTLAYGELYSFGNIDALFELHGHIRAANPRSDVQIFKESKLHRDDFAAHLVVLGGVDWNHLTRRLQDDSRLGIPVRQVSPGDDPAKACFETGSGKEVQQHWATVRDGELLSDVGQFVRTPNPYNRNRTLSICNGLYSLGTYGVVRSLTDTRFRERNEEYLRKRFERPDAFSLLMRIDVLNGDDALTPDWTSPTTVLHEWPE